MEGQVRQVSSKGELRQLRLQGRIPAVVYGGHEKSSVLSVDGKTLHKALTTEAGVNVVIQLKTGKSEDTVLVKEIQKQYLKHTPIHVDFQRISLKEKVEVHVPIHLIGTSMGVKDQGGVLEHVLREVDVRCVPTSIPSVFEVDISKLELNHSVFLKDISIPSDVELHGDLEQIVVHVVAPKIEEEPTPAAEGEAGAEEPEVIAKGKKPEEGEGEAEAKPEASEGQKEKSKS